MNHLTVIVRRCPDNSCEMSVNADVQQASALIVGRMYGALLVEARALIAQVRGELQQNAPDLVGDFDRGVGESLASDCEPQWSRIQTTVGPMVSAEIGPTNDK